MPKEEKEQQSPIEQPKNPPINLPIEPLIAAPAVLGAPAMLGVPLVIHALAGAAIGAFTFVTGSLLLKMTKDKALAAKPDPNEVIPPPMSVPNFPRHYSRNDPHIDSPLLSSLRK
uniref:Uncharacterized protein n=1 Tax=Chlorobium chlorochromatii (strain CaD3) TaxID=340177 RepID=Q3ARG6_CHLCH